MLQARARVTCSPCTFCMSANGLLQDAASPPKQGCEELLIDTARELLGDTGGMSDLSMLRRAGLRPVWALTAKCLGSNAVKQLQADGFEHAHAATFPVR